MILSHNIVTKKIAYVFINSECRGIPYKNALIRGKNAYKLFDEIFEFEEVHTLRDPSINIIEDTIDRMQAQAQDFERRVLERNQNYKDDVCTETVNKYFIEQVNIKKIKENKNFKPEKCNHEKEILDQSNAFECVNKILRELDREMTRDKFDEEFALIDFDGDEEISLTEMKNFI